MLLPQISRLVARVISRCPMTWLPRECPWRQQPDLVVSAELRRVEPAAVVVAVTAARGDDLVCRAELVMVMREAEAEWAGAIASARARVAAWKARA